LLIIKAKSLAQAVHRNSTLKDLSIGGNNIGSEGASKFAEALVNNSTLTELDINPNSIGDNGIVSIAKALETNKTLTKLNAANNNISDEGAQALVEALSKNTTLLSLDLNGNNITVPDLKSIHEKIRNNVIQAINRITLLQFYDHDSMWSNLYDLVKFLKECDEKLSIESTEVYNKITEHKKKPRKSSSATSSKLPDSEPKNTRSVESASSEPKQLEEATVTAQQTAVKINASNNNSTSTAPQVQIATASSPTNDQQYSAIAENNEQSQVVPFNAYITSVFEKVDDLYAQGKTALEYEKLQDAHLAFEQARQRLKSLKQVTANARALQHIDKRLAKIKAKLTRCKPLKQSVVISP